MFITRKKQLSITMNGIILLIVVNNRMPAPYQDAKEATLLPRLQRRERRRVGNHNVPGELTLKQSLQIFSIWEIRRPEYQNLLLE